MKDILKYVLISACSSAFATMAISEYREHVYDREVSGYISPRRIKIECKDINRDGTLETIMKVDTTKYLLMEKDGKPSLLEYTLIPRHDSLVIEK